MIGAVSDWLWDTGLELWDLLSTYLLLEVMDVNGFEEGGGGRHPR